MVNKINNINNIIASFSAPKVLHLLRCSPSVSHPSLERFDALLKQAIQRITNSVLSDLQWIQASLPVRDGCLGVRRVSSLALPAFLASAASTLSLQDDILTECAHSNSNFLQSCLADWSAKFGDVPDILPTKQPIWDRPGVLESKVEASLASAHNRHHSWQPLANTVEIGCLRCPSPHAD